MFATLNITLLTQPLKEDACVADSLCGYWGRAGTLLPFGVGTVEFLRACGPSFVVMTSRPKPETFILRSFQQ